MTRLFRFLHQTDATTSVEYAVMLALIMAVCIGAIRTFGQAPSGSLSASAAEIERYFPTGS